MYYSKVKVNVWDFHSPQSVGHASLALEDGTYISWWPESRSNLNWKTSGPKKLTTSLEEDKAKKKGDPNSSYVLTALKTDIDKVLQWWPQFCEKNKTYNGVRLNCCTVVYRAIKRLYAIPKLEKIKIIWTPWAIDRLLQQLVKTTKKDVDAQADVEDEDDFESEMLSDDFIANLLGDYETACPEEWAYMTEHQELDYTTVGHASMSLDDGTYISWWPKHGKLQLTMALDIEAPVELHTSVAEDSTSEGRPPDTSYTIPVMKEGADKVSKWWLKFCAEHKTYKGRRLNCCTVVYTAITVIYPGAKKIEHFIWTPGAIDKLAYDMSKVEVIRNSMFDYPPIVAMAGAMAGVVTFGINSFTGRQVSMHDVGDDFFENFKGEYEKLAKECPEEMRYYASTLVWLRD